MTIKLNDWIEHAVFGIGQVLEKRGEKLRVRFINSGDKTLVNSSRMWPLTAPSVTKFLRCQTTKVREKSGSKIRNHANDSESALHGAVFKSEHLRPS